MLVLCYHGVRERPVTRLEVAAAAFAEQLALLRSRGFRGATFHRAVTEQPHARTLAVTFDDAAHTVLSHAASVLERHGVPGTVFVPVGHVGREGVLGWDDLRELVRRGWEVGSHAWTHRPLTQLADAELREELVGSRRALEDELGVACRSLAYPYGAADARVAAATARAGYDAACVLVRRGRPSRLAWPRVGVAADGRLTFRLKTTRAGRRARNSLAGVALSRGGDD